MDAIAICKCQTCSAEISFERARQGEEIECPVCKLETRLYIPPTETSGVQKKASSKLAIMMGGYVAVGIVALFLGYRIGVRTQAKVGPEALQQAPRGEVLNTNRSTAVVAKLEPPKVPRLNPSDTEALLASLRSCKYQLNAVGDNMDDVSAVSQLLLKALKEHQIAIPRLTDSESASVQMALEAVTRWYELFGRSFRVFNSELPNARAALDQAIQTLEKRNR